MLNNVFTSQIENLFRITRNFPSADSQVRKTFLIYLSWKNIIRLINKTFKHVCVTWTCFLECVLKILHSPNSVCHEDSIMFNSVCHEDSIMFTRKTLCEFLPQLCTEIKVLNNVILRIRLKTKCPPYGWLYASDTHNHLRVTCYHE